MKRLLHALAALWPLPMRRDSCGFADSPIREFAKGPLPAGPNPYGSTDMRTSASSKQSESAHLQIGDFAIKSESATKNHPTTKKIFHLNRRYCNVLAYMALFMCLTAAKQVSAQAEPAAAAEIKPLQIGDTIPEVLWHLPLQVVNHPEGKETITLNDYRGKLIILDFWATWCGSCIAAMPKMDSLQRAFVNEVKILPVTAEDGAKIRAFVPTFQQMFGKEFAFASVTSDSLLRQLFPYRYLPHYVIIDGFGHVESIPASDGLTELAIAERLANNRPNWQNKLQNLTFDHNEPLVVDIDTNQVFGYRSTIREEIPGVGRISTILSPTNRKRLNRVVCINCTVPQLFLMLHHESGVLHENRIVFDLLDDNDRERFAGHRYCYELISQPAKVIKLREKVASDLGFHFDLRSSVCLRDQPCWTLSFAEGKGNIALARGAPVSNLHIASADIKFMKGFSLRHLVAHLNLHLPIPVLDESQSDLGIELFLPKDLSDTEALIPMLEQQGIIMEKATRKIDVLVISYDDIKI